MGSLPSDGTEATLTKKFLWISMRLFGHRSSFQLNVRSHVVLATSLFQVRALETVWPHILNSSVPSLSSPRFANRLHMVPLLARITAYSKVMLELASLVIQHFVSHHVQLSFGRGTRAPHW